jgi:hypothetical protein
VGSNVLGVIRFQTDAQNIQIIFVSQLMIALDLIDYFGIWYLQFLQWETHKIITNIVFLDTIHRPAFI